MKTLMVLKDETLVKGLALVVSQIMRDKSLDQMVVRPEDFSSYFLTLFGDVEAKVILCELIPL